MEEWKEYKLGEVCEYNTKRISLNLLNRDNYISTENMVPNIGGVTLSSNLPETGNAIHYTEGNILISNIRPYFKKIWYANKKGGCSADVLCIKVNEDIKDRYLYYLLSQQEFFDYVMAGAKGCKMPRGDKQHIMNWEISLPSLPTQQKIANILSSLDDKIEVNRRINEQLEELAQALFKSWFVDFEPFKDGEFVESELGMIPKGWKVGKYTDMVEIKGGGTPKTDIPEYWNGEIPFFTPKDVNNNVYCIETEKNISEIGLSKCSSKLYNKNTVFITARGTVGKVCMAGRNMAMNQTCYALLGKENYGQHFIYLQTINIVERMKKKANGAVFSAITTRDFDSEKIVIPPIEIVRNFSPKIESIYESILRNQQEITHLITLRDTLLPKLMSGEIDVNEVKI